MQEVGVAGYSVLPKRGLTELAKLQGTGGIQ